MAFPLGGGHLPSARTGGAGSSGDMPVTAPKRVPPASVARCRRGRRPERPATLRRACAKSRCSDYAHRRQSVSASPRRSSPSSGLWAG